MWQQWGWVCRTNHWRPNGYKCPSHKTSIVCSSLKFLPGMKAIRINITRNFAERGHSLFPLCRICSRLRCRFRHAPSWTPNIRFHICPARPRTLTLALAGPERRHSVHLNMALRRRHYLWCQHHRLGRQRERPRPSVVWHQFVFLSRLPI